MVAIACPTPPLGGTPWDRAEIAFFNRERNTEPQKQSGFMRLQVWDLVDDDIEMDTKDLVMRFAKVTKEGTKSTPAGEASAKAAAAKKKKKTAITVLDGKRQQNSGIALIKLNMSATVR